MEPITVDIWSDIACPWCYIGTRRFAAGRRAFGERADAPPVEVTHRAFQLSPEAPERDGGPVAEHLMRAKGMGEEQVHEMMAHVAGVAAGEGLAYDFDRVRHVNTGRAHELLHHARAHGRQGDMNERLMAAHFTEGRDVGDPSTLADLAAEAGLDRDEAAAALDDRRHRDAVEEDIATARSHGITGVPFFVFDGRYGVSGAQEADTFAAALEQVLAKRAGRAVT